ncbi:MAG: hypothetical protein RR274_01935, partial [Erysipelotrichaceae bacterium]
IAMEEGEFMNKENMSKTLLAIGILLVIGTNLIGEKAPQNLKLILAVVTSIALIGAIFCSFAYDRRVFTIFVSLGFLITEVSGAIGLYTKLSNQVVSICLGASAFMLLIGVIGYFAVDKKKHIHN